LRIIVLVVSIFVFSVNLAYSNPATVAAKQIAEQAAKASDAVIKKALQALESNASVLVKNLENATDAQIKTQASALAKALNTNELKGYDALTLGRMQRNFESYLTAVKNSNEAVAQRYLDEITEELAYTKNFRRADGAMEEGVVIVRVLDCDSDEVRATQKTKLMALRGESAKLAQNFESLPSNRKNSISGINFKIKDSNMREASQLEAYLLTQKISTRAGRSTPEGEAVQTILTKSGVKVEDLFDENGLMRNEWSFFKGSVW
jgi:hypothetical protein